MEPGVNIWSGTRGLGGALTNPTVLAKRKGNVIGDYPVVFRGREFADAETAYQTHARDLSFENRTLLMVEILTAKLRQHPRLVVSIDQRGGLAWLERCRHETGARTHGKQRWEGQGPESPFILALIHAYEAAVAERSQCDAATDERS